MSSGFVDGILNKAKELKRAIILPETSDDRVIKAASIAQKEGLAQIILIGKPDVINAKAESLNVSLEGVRIEDPETYAYTEEFVSTFQKRREKKGMTIEEARRIVKEDYMFFGAMMVERGLAHGMVGGALNTTAHTLRAMIQCVGTKPGTKSISSFFMIISPNQTIGSYGVTFFGDCAVIPNPDSQQLADIAEATADNFKSFTGKEANVAFLSFSTKGSAKTDETLKVAGAVEILKTRRPDLNVDGEMQFDAAIVPEVAAKKAPGSPVAGKANVLIFPTLDAANIGYKIAQRYGNCVALGPILQGANSPVNDLSRGCSVQEIVDVVAITAVQES